MELDVTCFNSYWFTATDTSLLHHKRVSQRVHWYFLQSPDICHQRPLRHWDIIRIAVPFYEILLFIFPPESLNFCLARPNWCLAQPRVFFISIPLELVSQSLFSTSRITDSPIQRNILQDGMVTSDNMDHIIYLLWHLALLVRHCGVYACLVHTEGRLQHTKLGW